MIRLGIVYGSKLVRIGLMTLLKANKTVDVVSEADTAQAAMEMARDLKPDVMILGLELNDPIGGIELTRSLKTLNPDIKIIIMNYDIDDERIIAALAAGGDAFCLQNMPNHLFEAIHTVHQGDAWLAPPIARRIATMFSEGRTITLSPLVHLTPSSSVRAGCYCLSDREQQILTLIVDGKNNTQIAEALHVSYHTVKSEVTHILQKLSVHDRIQAAVKALKEHLV